MPSPTHIQEHDWAEVLNSVLKPGRYAGGEVHAVCKKPEQAQLRWALLYPDAYEIGMPHQGLRILYHCLNQEREIWAERCFAPWLDMEQQLRSRGLPLCTLESRTPLASLDVLGFTLQTELSYTNILTCLSLGGVPLQTSKRNLNHPIVVAGGAGTINPEPIANFVDLFFLGDGEEASVTFSKALIDERPKHKSRRDLLRALVDRCSFLYAPCFWEPKFEGSGLLEMRAMDGVSTPTRALVYDLENAPYPVAPVIPNMRTIHDRISLEIMRGCVQNCRFCQAGYEKRPQRFRSAEKIIQIVKETYRNTGIHEVGLTSLSSSDHPDLLKILDGLRPWAKENRVSLSVPSLRVNEQVVELPKRIADGRVGTITLAPEVATDRLRKIINKNIQDEDLFQGVAEAWRRGFKNIKLYFMMGLPGEELEDLDGILDMSEKCSRIRKEIGIKGNGSIHAAVSTFIPKALTPFQWDSQIQPDEAEEKRKRLISRRKLRSVRFKFQPHEESWLEGFLSRGDRRAGATILAAWQAGARFDAWGEELKWDAWLKAFSDTGYGPNQVSWRERTLAEILPWDHLDHGVSRAFLEEEQLRARTSKETPHCQTETCSNCGIPPTLCVDLKATSGLFPKFSKPKLIAQARERLSINTPIDPEVPANR